jgi:hypothetical protein
MTTKNSLKPTGEIDQQAVNMAVDWKSGDIKDAIIVTGINNSTIKIQMGKNPQIDKLAFENDELQQELNQLTNSYSQAKHEVKIQQRSQQLMPGEGLEKYIIPVIVTILAATIAGAITPILGYVVGIGVAAYFYYNFSNKKSTPQPITTEMPKHEQLKLKIEGVKKQIAENKNEILRLYSVDINKGES